MKPFNVDTWRETADYVLAPLVAEQMVDENNHHFWKSIQAGLQTQHFPAGAQRQVYEAVHSLIMDKHPVHITTLQSCLNGSTPHDYIAQLYAMYQQGSTLSGHVFEANVSHLKDLGERAQMIRKLKETTEALLEGDNRSHEAIVSDAITAMISSGNDTIKNETASAMADDFTAYMSEIPEQTLKTGVDLIDSWVGALGNGDFMAIAAPMKQRKTSLTLNMLIHMARKGHSVALLMFESNKRMVNAMMVSMLAIEWLVKQGLYDATDTDEQGRTIGSANQIWASTLVRIQGRYPTLGRIRAEAIREGIKEFNRLGDCLRVYDRTKDGGSLNDNTSIHRICLRDKALYDTDFIAIDHAQRINEPGKDYEKLTAIVPYLESLARRENIAMCLLAQLKADEAEGTGNTHLSGIRGGAVLDEAVDYMLITGYKQLIPGDENGGRYPNDALKLGLQHSRYGDGGAHKRAFVKIDPNTGWILNGGRRYRE